MSDSRLVCDAPALVTVLLDSGNAGDWLARRLASADLAAPALLPFECSNVIRRHEVGGLISSDQAAQAHNDLVDLPIDLFPYEPLAQRVWQLRRNLTSYDAAYVALAEILDAPLITVDRRLAGAAGIACRVGLAPDGWFRWLRRGRLCGDQFGDVRTRRGQAAVEGRNPALVDPRQFGEIAVGNLPVPDDARERTVCE